MATSTLPKKKRGPVAQSGRTRVTVYLDEPLADWGKRQEGGLSDLLRRLLVEAREQAVQTEIFYPADLLANYRTLIERKLTQGLTAVEESELSRTRALINAADRVSLTALERERSAQAIDEEFAALRQRIEALPEIVSGS